jgi:hypothetical protein
MIVRDVRVTITPEVHADREFDIIVIVLDFQVELVAEVFLEIDRLKPDFGTSPAVDIIHPKSDR